LMTWTTTSRFKVMQSTSRKRGVLWPVKAKNCPAV
jgi:hypothetical protein